MISVIIPTYNQTSVLRWLLESLEIQDYRDEFEVIVCDDGSTENTVQVVSECAARGVLDLRYVWQPNRGFRLARSKNNAVALARGEILVFVESDCIVEPDFVRRHVAFHRKARGKPRLVGGTRTWVEADLSKPRYRSLKQLYREFRPWPASEDRGRQLRQFRSRLPWSGLLGFNFSVPKRPEIVFDEGLVGFGPDDLILFSHLYHRRRYDVVLSETLNVYHVSLPKLNAGWNPWFSRKAEHIENVVRNFIRLYHSVPGVDLTEAMAPLLSFKLDEKSDRWRVAKPGEPVNLPATLMTAQLWADRVHGKKKTRPVR